MIPTLPLEIQDLIIDEVAARKDQKTLRACQLVSHTFHHRTRHHLFSSITIHHVQFPSIGDRLALLRDIMLGIGSLPGIITQIKKLTINARTCPFPNNKIATKFLELTEEFFGRFDICLILRLLGTHALDANSRFGHLCLLVNQGFEWNSFHCVFEHAFSSLSRAPSVHILGLEGISGIPSTVILGGNIQRLLLLQSSMKKESHGSANPMLRLGSGWTQTPPPLEYLHFHDRFPVYLLSREQGCVAPKMNIADLSASIRTPEGYSTVESIGKLGSESIGNVKRLMLRYNARTPVFPNGTFNWWTNFPKLQTMSIHYRNIRITSSTDKLVTIARDILIPPTTTTTTHGATTANIHTVFFEFEFKTTLPFGPESTTSDAEYQGLISKPRWRKWDWLDEVLNRPFYAATSTRLKIAIRVFHPSPEPGPDEVQTAPVDTTEFAAAVSRALEVVLPELWGKGRVGVQCFSFPVKS